MTLPEYATVGVILPLTGAIVAIALFCFLYIRKYCDPYENDWYSYLAAIASLFIILITSALIPVDIFIVSIMKNPDGTFKDWALNITERDAIEDYMMYSYYALYSIVFICIFLFLPFMYFYSEERDDDSFGNNNRLCNAVKFTGIFLVLAVFLLLWGAFIPLRDAPPTNSTEWEKIKIMFDKLGENKGEDSISMVLSVLSSIGLINFIFYTAFGISSWPIGLIRGQKSARKQFEEIQDSHLINQSRITALREKQRIVGRLSGREQQLLTKLEEDERQNQQRESLVDQHRTSFIYKLRYLIRPLEITIGIIGLGLALLIWISLLLSNIDKALNSSLKMGYMLPARNLFNPMDYVLVYLQRIFPLDYILILAITWFLILCTLSGIRNLGIRVIFIKMYKLRNKKTQAQGLLLTCVILMLIALAINILWYLISPQYTSFGNQHYQNFTISPNSTNVTDINLINVMNFDNNGTSGNYTILECSNNADQDQCTITRSGYLLTRFIYKAWYFGAFYYWSSWVFIGISALGLIYSIFRKSRSLTDALVDEDDLEEDDDELIRPSSRRRSLPFY